MSQELVCPDCGGFIGLEPGDERQACHCFESAAPTPPTQSTLRPSIARMMERAAMASNASAAKANDDDAPKAAAHAADKGISDLSGVNSDSGASTISDHVVAPEKPEKACRKCSKDLAGHRRLKDSLGYICRECAKAEKPPEDPDRRPCPECGRMIKPGGFVPYNKKMICRRCFADHMELDKYKKAAPSKAGFVKREKQQLGKLLVYAGILAVLMAWSAYKHFGPK